MPLLNYEMIVLVTSTGKKYTFNNVPSIPRIGEKLLVSMAAVTPYTVKNITHDFGHERVIIEVE